MVPKPAVHPPMVDEDGAEAALGCCPLVPVEGPDCDPNGVGPVGFCPKAFSFAHGLGVDAERGFVLVFHVVGALGAVGALAVVGANPIPGGG